MSKDVISAYLSLPSGCQWSWLIRLFPIPIRKQTPHLPFHRGMFVCTEYRLSPPPSSLSETGWAVWPRLVSNSSSFLCLQSPGITGLCHHAELVQVHVNTVTVIVTPGVVPSLVSEP